MTQTHTHTHILSLENHVLTNRHSLPIGRAELIGREIAVQFHRGNFTAAHRLIDRAQSLAAKLAGESWLDFPLEDIGLSPDLAIPLTKAGYHSTRDLLAIDDTHQLSRRIKSLTRTKAESVLEFARRIEREDNARRRTGEAVERAEEVEMSAE